MALRRFPSAWMVILVGGLLGWMGLDGGPGLRAEDITPPNPPPSPPGVEEPPPSGGNSAPADSDYLVTILKEPAPEQSVPASATVLTAADLRAQAPRSNSEAAARVPNLLMQEFTARKLSFPFMRGIGAGPLNPAVTTCIDGVPQLHANSSSQELYDLERIEFVRGAQGLLYGRNTLGGVINVVTAAPDREQAGARADLRLGSFQTVAARAAVSAPVSVPASPGALALGLAGGYSARNGFTENRVTGDDLDRRQALFGRAQAGWDLGKHWQARLIAGGESARDGDYALGDLAQLRSTPRRVSHDYTGHTDRDLANLTLRINNTGQGVEFTAISGYGYWRTQDVTDLDATATDLIVRSNHETMTQWSQEFRWAAGRPVALGPEWELHWLGGLFFFHTDYGQDAYNALSTAAAAGAGVPFPFQDISRAELTDDGAAICGQAGLRFTSRWELTAGLRFDHEHKQALLETSTSPAIAAFTRQSLAKSFDRLIPQGALSFRPQRDVLLYLSLAGGFKAGGFNANAPAGKAAYDPESNWTLEWGAKSAWLERRLRLNAALFYIDWRDLQLDVPNTLVPGRFYIDNVGRATSRGGEVEVSAQPVTPLELFAALGLTDAHFRAGSMASGTAVGGHRLPYAPAVTASFGARLEGRVSADLELFCAWQTHLVGRYAYDASNRAHQPAYGLTDLRAGFRSVQVSMAVYAHNLFAVETVPLAFPYPGLAASGYVGESGAPATFGTDLEVKL